MASRMVDLPLSPGPIRQFTPGLGSQRRLLTARKFSISSTRTNAILLPPLVRHWECPPSGWKSATPSRNPRVSAGDMAELDLQCKCITWDAVTMQGAGYGQDR